MPTDEDHQALEQARVRHNAYGFVAAALRYPDREALATLRKPDCWSGWVEAMARSEPGLFKLLDAARASLSGDDHEAQMIALQDTHTRLFGHAVRGTCPPYELEYGRGDIPQKASELADIAGFYNAFGMELDAGAHERTDHVAVQCEFMGVLALKEIYALDTDNAQAKQTIRDAQRSFLADHAGRWMPAFAARLADSDSDGFYGRLGRFFGEFVNAECRRFNVCCGPHFLELRPTDPDRDAKIECGVETSCPGASAPSETDALVQVGIDRD